ncbi:MAG: hypothetical protein LBN22_01705 [Clostridiales Family XIII bacterium]|jgi:hypothetical protein|nr:hypothetical protein [Clostridiales Family XIII bacterium]
MRMMDALGIDTLSWGLLFLFILDIICFFVVPLSLMVTKKDFTPVKYNNSADSTVIKQSVGDYERERGIGAADKKTSETDR